MSPSGMAATSTAKKMQSLGDDSGDEAEDELHEEIEEDAAGFAAEDDGGVAEGGG